MDITDHDAKYMKSEEILVRPPFPANTPPRDSYDSVPVVTGEEEVAWKIFESIRSNDYPSQSVIIRSIAKFAINYFEEEQKRLTAEKEHVDQRLNLLREAAVLVANGVK